MLNDIKRILWHEFGHLCVNILKVQNNNQLTIDNVQIAHVNYVDENLFKWKGHVEILPKIPFEKVVEDYSLLAYSVISIISGCIFETVFFQQILNDETKKFEDCFCHKNECVGNGDFENRYRTYSALRNKFPVIVGDVKAHEFLERDFVREYEEDIKELKDFFLKLNEIVNIEAQSIFNEFENNKKYSFEYSNENLENLSHTVINVMSAYGFIDVVERNKEKFIDYIESFEE